MKRLAIVGALVVLAGALPAHARVTIQTNHYTLRTFRWSDNHVAVTTFVAGDGFMLKKVNAYRTFSGRKRTSAMGIQSRALAAINGDFRWIGTNAPKHLSAIDGEIISTGNQPGWVLRTNADGTRGVIGKPIFNATVTQGDVSFPLSGWNAQQPGAEPPRYLPEGWPVAFTARGGSDRHPSVRSCSALLAPVAGVRGEFRRYEVVQIRKDCARRPLQPPAGQYQWVVLHGRKVASLTLGELQMRVGLGLGGDARQVVGGTPQVLDAGVNVGPTCPSLPCPKTGSGPDAPLFKNNPRTAVGISRGCTDHDPLTTCQYHLVTVDGRSPGWSEGVRFPALARIFLELGAWDALNLDGGGSTTMWVRDRSSACQLRRSTGCVVNRPSYGEREILDAVALVRV